MKIRWDYELGFCIVFIFQSLNLKTLKIFTLMFFNFEFYIAIAINILNDDITQNWIET